MKILLILLVILNCLDIYTTKKAIDGGAHEANPIAAKFVDKFGVVGGLAILKGASLALIIAGVMITPTTSLMTAMLALADMVYAWVVVHNYKLTKNNG